MKDNKHKAQGSFNNYGKHQEKGKQQAGSYSSEKEKSHQFDKENKQQQQFGKEKMKNEKQNGSNRYFDAKEEEE